MDEGEVQERERGSEKRVRESESEKFRNSRTILTEPNRTPKT